MRTNSDTKHSTLIFQNPKIISNAITTTTNKNNNLNANFISSFANNLIYIHLFNYINLFNFIIILNYLYKISPPNYISYFLIN